VVETDTAPSRATFSQRLGLRLSPGGAMSTKAEPVEVARDEPTQVELTEDGLPKPRWGLGEAFGGFALAIVIGGLAAGVILAIAGYEAPLPAPGGNVGRAAGQVLTG
jgi:hypothetical protein